MKIAINCAFFYPKAGGIKQYIYNLVWNLYRLDTGYEFVLYVPDDYMDYAKERLPKDIRKKSIGYTTKQAVKRSLFESLFWKREESIEKFDLFHSPFFHAPTFKKAKVVLTAHDLRLEVLPETYSKLRLVFLKYKVPRSIKRADHIITISYFTKSEIIKYYGVSTDKITPILEAIDTGFFNIEHVNDNLSVIDGKYILTVGHVETRKNYLRLIEAFEKFKNRNYREDTKLVIVGQLSHDYEEFIAKVNQNPDIIYLNFVESEVLLWLYKNAEFFIMPSLYEGFGFPPLEAAAMGTVSVVSRVSSLPEVCGDAAVYFDPMDTEDMARAMERVFTDERLKEKLREASEKNLKKFSWEKNAQETVGVYKKILKL